MSQNSKIEWCDNTRNLWWGCEEVHEGCDNCYAKKWAIRYKKDLWGKDKPRLIIESVWENFRADQKRAEKNGKIEIEFVGSMMDFFEKPLPIVDNKGNFAIDCSDGSNICTDFLREKFIDEIVPVTPNLLHLLVTKRETNILKYIPESWRIHQPDNVMYGVSVSNQKHFDRVVKNLEKVPGKKFLSIEPQIGPISLGNLTGIDWIIQGGESGGKKRKFDIEWARSMRDECAALNIPYFFKQIDKIQDIPDDLQIRQFPQSYYHSRKIS